MTTLVAAVEPGPLTADVVDVARRLARAVGVEPVALWVTSDADRSPVAPEVDITLVERSGDPVNEILTELSRSDAIAVVVGLRTVPAGAHPAGHVTERLLTETEIPIVVVPPNGAGSSAAGVGPVVVPIEGGQPPGDTLATLLAAFEAAGEQVVPMHVFDRTTVPMFWDGWHDRDLWRHEFSRRYAPSGASPTQLRAGVVAQEILAEAERRDARLVALEWNRNLTHPRAPVVRRLLDNTRIPLLLVPLTVRANRFGQS